MAIKAVLERNIAIRLACTFFLISVTCYRYQSKQNAENLLIAN